MQPGEVFVARQPIFDRSRRVIAYELLFRTDRENFARISNPREATEHVISASYLDIGIQELTSGLPAYINFSRELLLDGTPTILPPEQVVVEVLEDVLPDPGILAALQDLRQRNYRIALDDFVGDAASLQMVPFADILKVDLVNPPDVDLGALVESLGNRHGGRPILIAEKVESHRQLCQARDLGFDFFQGHFFCEPQIVESTRLSESKLAHLRLLQTAQSPVCDQVRLEEIIKSDVALTAKLLKYINAAAFPWVDSIRSVHHALTLMGETNIRKWIALVALTGMAVDKPWELAVASTCRGRFCELAGRIVDRVHTDLEHFLLGALSALDALLDIPMEAALRQLPLSAELRSALCGEGNSLRDLLDLSRTFERGNWTRLEGLCRKLSMKEESLPGIYCEALRWSDRVLRA